MSMETVTPESTYDVYEYEHIHRQLMDAMGETGKNLGARDGEIVTATIDGAPAQYFTFRSPSQEIYELRVSDTAQSSNLNKAKPDKSPQPPAWSEWLSLQLDHPAHSVPSRRLSYVTFKGDGIVKALAFNPTGELQHGSVACVDTLASRLNDFLLSLKLIERA